MKHWIMYTGQHVTAAQGLWTNKFSEKKTYPEIITKKTENRGSADPLLEVGYPLKLGALLS
jgi:hypothetical protein